MPTLFSYVIPYDDGAAPNPYWGVCTLTICKPVIRRIAKVGDWIVGTGSKNSPIKDVSNKVVYAMKVTKILSMQDYDKYVRTALPEKIPEWHSSEYEHRVGDSIYDFDTDPPKLRKGVHGEGNRATDLRGKNALLSEHFYYFGDNPEPLPTDLLSIVKTGQGHRSTSNQPHFDRFVSWIENSGFTLNERRGNPQLILPYDEEPGCQAVRCEAAELDEQLGPCD